MDCKSGPSPSRAGLLWSRHRLFKASKVADARCRCCGLDDEHTDHLLWSCSANDTARRELSASHGFREEFLLQLFLTVCLSACDRLV